MMRSHPINIDGYHPYRFLRILVIQKDLNIFINGKK